MFGEDKNIEITESLTRIIALSYVISILPFVIATKNNQPINT
jgi:hypothetical protein